MATWTKPDFAKLTVNEAVRLFPETIDVFNEFGIDSCCGGGSSIELAAGRDGADCAQLVKRLHEAVEQA